MNEQVPSKELLIERRHLAADLLESLGYPKFAEAIRCDQPSLGERETATSQIPSARGDIAASGPRNGPTPQIRLLLEVSRFCVRNELNRTEQTILAIEKSKPTPSHLNPTKHLASLNQEATRLRQTLDGIESYLWSAHEPPADDGSEVDELYALLVRRGWSQQDANEIAHMRSPVDDSMAPIACIRVGEDDTCEVLKLYAPGLPPGEHDLYPAASSQPPGAALVTEMREWLHVLRQGEALTLKGEQTLKRTIARADEYLAPTKEVGHE